ncbi:MAG: hypothetical protein ACOCSE_01970, partial [Chitinivibrionales bacterium]
MLMFTEKMVKIVAVTLKKWSERVAALLLEEGIVDFTQLANSSEVLLKYQKDDKSSEGDTKIAAILSKIEAFLKPEGIVLPAPDQDTLKKPDRVDLEETRKIIEDLNSSVKKIRTKQQGLQQELLKLREIKKNIESFGPDIKTPLTKTNSSFLSFRTGKVPLDSKQEIETSLSRYPAVTIESSVDPDGRYIFLSVIFMKRDRETVEGILNKAGWIDIEIDSKMFDSSGETASKKIDDKISTILEKQRKLEENYSDIIKKHSKDLKERYKTLKASQLSAKVQSFFTHSSDTILFSGWLVKSGKKRIEEKLRKATHNECF